MDTISIIFIALGLAMDAFAVSITAGLTIEKNHLQHAFRIALYFGVFQAVMPLFGWLLASSFSDFIGSFQKYVAFVILTAIGIKMIADSRKPCSIKNDFSSHKTLLLLAIATSIDAFATGVSFQLVHLRIIQPVIIIGIVTFCTSIIGVYAGKISGCLLRNYADVFGGVILIGIAVKMVLKT
ncbi:MAG: manganese efflux pump MntP family protein [Candidatus Cloacimonetes bacterium]|nr:manganese efflux pump MntP family protein [Candidatus Cloacimonadota bacterium]